jgi:hypothetical protein
MHGISGPCQITQLDDVGLHPSCVLFDFIGSAISLIYLLFFQIPKHYYKVPVPDTSSGMPHVKTDGVGHSSSSTGAGGTIH